MDLVDSTVKSLRSLANERRERYMEIIIYLFIFKKKQNFSRSFKFFFFLHRLLFVHSLIFWFLFVCFYF